MVIWATKQVATQRKETSLNAGNPRYERVKNSHATRLGAAAAIAGQVLLAASSAFHPAGQHPADHQAVFREYAESSSWTTVHLVQWAGGVLMFLALALLAHHLISTGSRGSVVARIAFGASITVAAIFTALQAVDGVSLKMAVDAWVQAGPERQAATFSAAEAIRWIEIGLNALGRIVQGVAIASVAVAAAAGGIHGRVLAALGLTAGIGAVASGFTTAYTGFSSLVAVVGMGPMILQMVWLVATGIAMWRNGTATALNQPAP